MDYITSVRKQFIYYKTLGEKAIDQLEESQLFIQKNEESNSIAVIISHLAGNMLSRWTDVLTTDGEKPWRNRDAEFENILSSKIEVMNLWNKGWTCLFVALDSLTEKDLDTIIYIRHEGHTVLEALNRQLAHYPYHIGQIVYIAKELKTGQWNSLSIPKNASNQYNDGKFAKEKSVLNFTEDEIDRLSKMQ